ncbi:DNA replication and repair protein RecF [Candidatus Clavichlamydia salmonicola]|uniref:DNA replication/repair protein RecF n=1 Tax=Candidatus Clavichlamydia salmonicola TaxID=469812 RepID=UPI001891677B|nr:DNA replication and repair protein RecF [Candidatus Clavichlamydia salmonicola]MBF5050864.1 DNA replication and repair protein RecF [Candidatus Clavichlamydia salmonicola]
MKITSLYLKNFRNYKEQFVTFGDNLNFIYGKNAQGKTSLLEAFSLFMTGRSFKTSHLADCIHWGEKHFFLEIIFKKFDIDQSLSFFFDRKGKKILYNTTPLPTLSTLPGILPGVILHPDHVHLIKGSPAERRSFLDLQLIQSDPFYLYHFSRYNRSLKNRNTLLKIKNFASIEVWEEQLAIAGAYLIQARSSLINLINQKSQEFHQSFWGFHEQLEVIYKPGIKENNSFEKKELILLLNRSFQKLRSKEAELGNTLTGPHRDDMIILNQEKAALAFSSTGQQRCCTASLKFAEYAILSDRLKDIRPVMCIDDPETSLDNERAENLCKEIPESGQMFISSPQLRSSLPPSTHLLQVIAGSIQEHSLLTCPVA